jgi:hypothetical protein
MEARPEWVREAEGMTDRRKHCPQAEAKQEALDRATKLQEATT